MRLRIYFAVFGGILVVIILSVLLWFYISLTTPLLHNNSEKYITVPKGSTPNQIVASLAEKRVIRSPLALRIYLRISGKSGNLKAGDYKFPSPVNALQVVELLEEGNERAIRLTIPEGWTRFEIAARIAKTFPTEPPMDEKAVLYLMNDTSAIKDFAPKAENLEGFLYPTTYDFPIGTRPEEVIDRMVKEFRKVWQPEWTIKAENLGRTPFEIVTIASLIENESKFGGERKVVASVIYNRLDRGMALGIDATNVYIAKMLGKWDGTIHKSDIEVNHPYNTRKIAGLPPGPISSASKSAFEAALDPAKTDYLYYVLDVDKNDGSHKFFSSAAEFERAKAKYQRWLEKQRGEK